MRITIASSLAAAQAYAQFGDFWGSADLFGSQSGPSQGGYGDWGYGVQQQPAQDPWGSWGGSGKSAKKHNKAWNNQQAYQGPSSYNWGNHQPVQDPWSQDPWTTESSQGAEYDPWAYETNPTQPHEHEVDHEQEHAYEHLHTNHGEGENAHEEGEHEQTHESTTETPTENEGEQTPADEHEHPHVDPIQVHEHQDQPDEHETHTHQDPYEHHQVVHENEHTEHEEHECPDLSHLVHFDTADYQAQSAYCKQQMIWKKVIADRTPQKFFVGDEFQGFFEQDMNLSFDTVSDTMPVGRIKRTHPVGTTTLVEFIAQEDTPYTGIFKGAKHGVMRISEFAETQPHVLNTAPGHAVKFLRDGMASANWFAMFAFDGQMSHNFFKNRWTNILREMQNECARHTIGKHLNEVSDHTGAMSIMELSQFDQYGNEIEDHHWPFQIDVQPYDVYGWTDEWQNDFLEQLGEMPIDTAMFKIFAYDEPPELGGQERLIGHLVSRSETTSSLWGDEMLYFQHHRYEDDIRKRPHYFEWLEFWTIGRFTEQPLQNPAPMQSCPFMFLFANAGLI